MVRSEGNVSLKNPVTRPGIDPGTFRLVAQRLPINIHIHPPSQPIACTNPVFTITSADLLSLPLPFLPPASRFSFPQSTLCLNRNPFSNPPTDFPNSSSHPLFGFQIPAVPYLLTSQPTPPPADWPPHSTIAPVDRLSQLSIPFATSNPRLTAVYSYSRPAVSILRVPIARGVVSSDPMCSSHIRFNVVYRIIFK